MRKHTCARGDRFCATAASLSIAFITPQTSIIPPFLTCLFLLSLYPYCLQILVLDPNRELRWRDYRGPILSSFFRGSHWWILEPLPNGHTRFLHGAEMFGLALPFLRPTMHAIRRGYDVFNKALRKEVLAQLQQVGVGSYPKGSAQMSRLLPGGGGFTKHCAWFTGMSGVRPSAARYRAVLSQQQQQLRMQGWGHGVRLGARLKVPSTFHLSPAFHIDMHVHRTCHLVQSGC